MALSPVAVTAAPQTPISSKITELRSASEDVFNSACNLAHRLHTVLDVDPTAPSPQKESAIAPEPLSCELFAQLQDIVLQVRETTALLGRIDNAVQL